MPTFDYKAVSAGGELVSGTIEAGDRRAAVRKLQARQCKPTQVKEVGAADTPARAPVAFERKPEKEASGSAAPIRIRSSDAIALTFFRKLHQLHKSGMPVGDAVRTLYQRMNDPQQKEIAAALWRDLSEGRPLAQSIRQMPDVFDPSFSHLIEAGEATGNLKPIFAEICENLESRIALKKKVVAGLTYPALLCLMAIGVTLLLLFYLQPKIENMMENMGTELSLPAKILNTFTELSVTWGPIALGAAVVAALMTIQYRKTQKGRLATDQWLLRLPLAGPIVENMDLSRLCHLLGTLLSNGVNATEALKLTGKTVQNRVLADRFNHARILINDGASFAMAFRKHQVLPDDDLDILAIGENTGAPEESLREIHHERAGRLDRQLSRLTVGIAGGALGGVFILIGLVVLSIVMSVGDMTSSILQGGV